MEAVDELVAIERIKALKARYFRYVDTQRWDDFRTLFADDASLLFPENSDEPKSIQDVMERLPEVLTGGVSIHHGHMPEIDITGPDTARAIWAMDDQLFFPTDVTGIAGASVIRGAGHYHETYVRQDGRWLIKSLKLTRLRFEVIAQPRSVT